MKLGLEPTAVWTDPMSFQTPTKCLMLIRFGWCWLRALTFSERWRRHIPRSTHINITELRAHLLEEKRIAANMSSRRVLYALDSQVSLGCLVKGRAPSSALNRELVNRADGPTRDAEPAPPDLDYPSWWEDACAGAKLAPEPEDFALLGKKSTVSLASGRAVRTKAFRQTRAKKLVSSPRSVPKVQTCAEESAESAATISGLPHRALELLRAPPKRQVFFQEGIRAMIKLGAPWVLTFEWNRSAGEDLLARNVIIEPILL